MQLVLIPKNSRKSQGFEVIPHISLQFVLIKKYA